MEMRCLMSQAKEEKKVTDDHKTLEDLLEVMAALRTPETGCRWDLKQTFATIVPYTIEEAYEVADAVARSDMDELKDELGDLLLQVVYHARMAEEQNAFDFADVANAITTKMIRRHPHVFGTAEERAAGATPGFWDRIKQQEKSDRDASDDTQRPPRTLDDIPVALPGLTRAIKLQNKAAKVGFDWPDLTPVFDKVREELAELEAVVVPASAAAPPSSDADDAAANRAQQEEELGDLLFVVANIARHLKIDPETALRGANQKFIRRFAFIEDELAGDGRRPEHSTLEEMDALWDAAKRQEGKP
jgi:nucleoside triphosphate diphosphatase